MAAAVATAAVAAVAAAGVAAAGAVQELPAPGAAAAKGGKRKAAAPVDQRVLGFKQAKPKGSSAAESTSLGGEGKRGQLVVVQPAASYGAGKTYFFSDVVAVGRLLLAGKIQPKDLDERLSDGSLKYKVPRSTMKRWGEDDFLVMADKGQRGLQGEPHWKVESEVRGRTELTRAGVGTVSRCDCSVGVV